MSLVTAAREGDMEKVIELLEANPGLVNEGNIFGETALHEAIFYGNEEIAIYLLSKNANPIHGRPDGNRPLHLAANKGRFTVAKLLLTEYGKYVLPTINAKNSLGNTALHEGCKKTQVDIIELLVNNHINIEIINRRGQKAIDYTRDMRVIRLLRGQQWFQQLSTHNICKRLKNGITFNETMAQCKQLQQKQKQKQKRNNNSIEQNINSVGNRKTSKNLKQINDNDTTSLKTANNNNDNKLNNSNTRNNVHHSPTTTMITKANDNYDHNHQNEKQQSQGKPRAKRKRRQRKRNRNRNRKNASLLLNAQQKLDLKDTETDLQNWIEFTDFANVEKQQQYQCVYFDHKLRMKWIRFMQQSLKTRTDLSMREYNRRMSEFAELLYIEYSQPIKAQSAQRQ